METERILPQEIGAERSILAGMTEIDTYFWRALSELVPECFYLQSHKTVFEAFQKEKRHDYPLLQKTLENCPDLGIEDIITHDYSTTGDTEIKLVLEAYRRREAIRHCQTAVNALFSDTDTPATETTSQTISRLNSIQCGSGKEIWRIGELLPGEFERMEAVAKGSSVSFIKTGFKCIDSSLSIQQHDYIIIGARPSNCKSTIAAAISRNVCFSKKLPVLYFCLDASKRRETSRHLFTMAGVSLSQFNLGFTAKREMPRISMVATQLSEIPLYLDDTPGTTANQIVAKSQRLKHEAGGLCLIVVDFLQNVFSRQRNERDRVNETSSILHNLPRIVDCPVIALSQVARYENEIVSAPKLSNLKESGNLEADADVVMMLWYSDFYDRNRTEKQKEELKDMKGKLMVDIAKYKDGSVGTQLLKFKPSITRLSDLDEPDPLQFFRGE